MMHLQLYSHIVYHTNLIDIDGLLWHLKDIRGIPRPYDCSLSISGIHLFELIYPSPFVDLEADLTEWQQDTKKIIDTAKTVIGFDTGDHPSDIHPLIVSGGNTSAYDDRSRGQRFMWASPFGYKRLNDFNDFQSFVLRCANIKGTLLPVTVPDLRSAIAWLGTARAYNSPAYDNDSDLVYSMQALRAESGSIS